MGIGRGEGNDIELAMVLGKQGIQFLKIRVARAIFRVRIVDLLVMDIVGWVPQQPRVHLHLRMCLCMECMMLRSLRSRRDERVNSQRGSGRRWVQY